MDYNGLDDFINNASDQAAAWYSIVAGQPVAVPSATIASQNAIANVPITQAQVQTPFGSYSYLGGDAYTLDIAVVIGAVVLLFLLIKK